jgi:5'-methylthioadenosine phosphorylase
MGKPLVGVIGGSGLYNIPSLQQVEEVTVETPFGPTSDKLRVGKIHGRDVVFLPRHGRHHSLTPSEVPHRANIWAMKSLGVRWIISASAVGSLKEQFKPRDFVFPLQFFDRTKQSTNHTFFGGGIVAHVSFGSPICEALATILFQSANMLGATCHWGGTYVNMEGPAFSTLAESETNRAAGFDVIGMTNLGEAKLAREAEISYATMAMVTDYDCWHSAHGEVSAANIIDVLRDNSLLGQKVIEHAIQQIPLGNRTPAHKALETALLTPRQHWPENRISQLHPILSRYL